MKLPNSPMPRAETELVLRHYELAKVILEYGSGASTKIAAKLSGKKIFSVESDWVWAQNLRKEIADDDPKSEVLVEYVDIGKTASWGRVIDESKWKNYHHYPNKIWDESFFVFPDVILIDGRFRTACLVTAMMRATAPVTVLFDDYIGRPKYSLVERIVKPASITGRMARFDIVPGMIKPKDMGFAIEQYFQVTVHGLGNKAYQLDDIINKNENQIL